MQLAPAHYNLLPRETPGGRPRAFEYFELFKTLTPASSAGWHRIDQLADAARGDIISWRFPTVEAGSDTGHVLVCGRHPEDECRRGDHRARLRLRRGPAFSGHAPSKYRRRRLRLHQLQSRWRRTAGLLSVRTSRRVYNVPHHDRPTGYSGQRELTPPAGPARASDTPGRQIAGLPWRETGMGCIAGAGVMVEPSI